MPDTRRPQSLEVPQPDRVLHDQTHDDALSPCSQKVRLVLAEKGLQVQLEHVNLSRKENLNPDYMKLNPKGVLPTLVEDDLVVTESSIIMDLKAPSKPTRPS